MITLGQTRIYRAMETKYKCQNCKNPILTGQPYITSHQEFKTKVFTSNFHPLCHGVYAITLLHRKEGRLNRPRGSTGRVPRQRDPVRTKLLRRRNYLINKLLNWQLTDEEQLECYNNLIDISKNLKLARDNDNGIAMDKKRTAKDKERLGELLNDIAAKIRREETA